MHMCLVTWHCPQILTWPSTEWIKYLFYTTQILPILTLNVLHIPQYFTQHSRHDTGPLLLLTRKSLDWYIFLSLCIPRDVWDYNPLKWIYTHIVMFLWIMRLLIDFYMDTSTDSHLASLIIRILWFCYMASNIMGSWLSWAHSYQDLRYLISCL
jgi:hypothetical protein